MQGVEGKMESKSTSRKGVKASTHLTIRPPKGREMWNPFKVNLWFRTQTPCKPSQGRKMGKAREKKRSRKEEREITFGTEPTSILKGLWDLKWGMGGTGPER